MYQKCFIFEHVRSTEIPLLFIFLKEEINGNFNILQAVMPAIAAAIGGLIGSKIALKTKSEKLKLLFAITTLLASIIMVVNAVVGK